MDPYDYDSHSMLSKNNATTRTASIDAYKRTTETSSQCLHATWSSALCVNSLYDAYSQAQADNESLRKKVTLMNQEIDILKQTVLNAKQGLQPEARATSQELEHKHPETHLRAKCDDLQSQLEEYKRLYMQQVAKYDAKFAINPLEEKRVSVSLRAMQTTLDKAQHEKDELLSQYEEIRDYNKSLENQQLYYRKKLGALEEQHLHDKGRLLFSALRSLMMRLLANAWRRWKSQNDHWVTKKKLQDKDVRFQNLIEQLLTKKAQIQQLNEYYQNWREFCAVRLRHQINTEVVLKKRSRSIQNIFFSSWKNVIFCKRKNRFGMEALESRTLHRYKTMAVRNWQVHSLRQVKKALIRQKSLSSTLEADLKQVQKNMETVKAESSILDSKYLNELQIQQNEHQACAYKLHLLHSRLANFVCEKYRLKKLTRLFLSWLESAKYTLRIRRNTEQLVEKRTTIHVRDAVVYWHRFVRFRVISALFIRKLDDKSRKIQTGTHFSLWREWSINERRRKRLIGSVVLRSQRKIYENFWGIWRASLTHKQSKRITTNSTAQNLTKYAHHRLFMKWKRVVFYLRNTDGAEESVKRFLPNAGRDAGKFDHFFLTWKRKLQSSRLLKRFQTQQHTRQRFRILRNLWYGWQKFITLNRSQKMLLRRALTHVYYILLQRSWNILSRQVQLQKMAMIRKLHADELLAKDKKLQDTIESSSAQIASLQHRMNGAVSKLSVFEHRQSLLQNGLYFLGKCHQNVQLSRYVYTKWSKWISRRKSRQKCLDEHRKTLLDRRTRRCIIYWRDTFNKSKNRHHAIRHRLTHVFSELIYRTIIQKWHQVARQSHFVRRHTQNAIAQRKSGCWRKWKEYARICRTTRFFHHCTNRILRNGLIRWKDVYDHDQRLERLRDRDKQRETFRLGILDRHRAELLLIAFQKWHANTQIHRKRSDTLRQIIEKKRREMLLQAFLKWIRSNHTTLWMRAFWKRYFIHRWKSMGFKHWYQVIVRIKHQEWVDRGINAQNLSMKVDQTAEEIERMKMESQKEEKMTLLVRKIQKAHNFYRLQQTILWRWHFVAYDENKFDRFRVSQHIHSRMQKSLLIVFTSWKTSWVTSKKLERCTKILEWRRSQAAAAYLERWKQRGRLGRIDRCTIKKIDRQRMRICLRRWRTSSNEEKNEAWYRLIYWKRERKNRQKRRVFLCWKAMVCWKHSLLVRYLHFRNQKHNKSFKQSAFHSWKSVICVQKARKKRLQLILMKKQKTEMKISWKLWHASTIRLREQYAQSRHIIRLRHLRYMHSAFTKWQKEVHCAHKRSWIAKNSELLISNKKNQEQIEEAKNAIQLMHPQLIMQSQSLRDLKSEKLQIEQELRAKLMKVQIKYRSCRRSACIRDLKLAWSNWKYQVKLSRQARIKLNCIHRQRRGRLTKQTWFSWIKYTNSCHVIVAKIRQHNRKIMQTAWMDWRLWHSQHRRCKQLLSLFVRRIWERRMQRVESVLFIWKKNIKAAEEVAKLQKINAKLCEQLTSKASRLRLFTLWNIFQKRNVKMALRLFLWKWRVSSHKSLTSTSTSESVSVNGVQISHHALRNVRSMIQRLSQSLVMEEFFDAVRVSISQCVAHGAGILLLLDPCRQQLWHIHAKRTIQIPSVFGIAGMAVASLEPIFVQDVTKDSRYHPLVDQYAVSGLGHIESR